MITLIGYYYNNTTCISGKKCAIGNMRVLCAEKNTFEIATYVLKLTFCNPHQRMRHISISDFLSLLNFDDCVVAPLQHVTGHPITGYSAFFCRFLTEVGERTNMRFHRQRCQPSSNDNSSHNNNEDKVNGSCSWQNLVKN